MTPEELAGAKDFENWMIEEENRIKNNRVEIITPVEKKYCQYFNKLNNLTLILKDQDR